MRVTSPVHLFLFDLNAFVMFGEEYNEIAKLLLVIL